MRIAGVVPTVSRRMVPRSTAVDGQLYRWLEMGEGEAVVLLHGIPTSPSLWRYVMPRIPGAHLLAWELPGYGGSIARGDVGPLSLSVQTERLIQWLDALEIRRAILVGHDLGGGIAQIAAVRHPERVCGLVLINSVCYDSWPIPSVRALARSARLVERLPDTAVRELLRTMYLRGHDDSERAREALEIHGSNYENSPDGAGAALVRQARALDNADTMAVAAELPGLRIPVRIVWGGSDRFQKVKWARRLARDLDAPLKILPGAKHFVPEDHPEAVAQAIREVIGDLAWWRIPSVEESAPPSPS